MKKLLAVLCVAVVLSGCLGSFNLTKKVYKFNNQVGDKWVNELVFLGFCVLPVYNLATFIDAVVLNTIEFWSGKNPMAYNKTDNESIALDHSNKRLVLSSKYSDKVRVDVFDSFKPQSSFVFEKHNDCVTVKNTSGEILYKSMTNKDGSISVVDAQGKLIKTCSAEEVNRLY